VIDVVYDILMNRIDQHSPIFDAAEIARLVKECHNEGHQTHVEEEEDDDTLLEYCSDDEGGATLDVDSDDE
jgi:hypothetical protein